MQPEESSSLEQVAVAPKVVKRRYSTGSITKTGDIVLDAIAKLKDRHGSTFAKIKNYIIANHNIDFGRFRHRMKAFLAEALEKKFITTSTTGTNGHAYYRITDPKLRIKYGLFAPPEKTMKSPTAPKPKPRVQAKAVEKKTNETTDSKKKAKKTDGTESKSNAEGTKKTKKQKNDKPKTKKSKKIQEDAAVIEDDTTVKSKTKKNKKPEEETAKPKKSDKGKSKQKKTAEVSDEPESSTKESANAEKKKKTTKPKAVKK